MKKLFFVVALLLPAFVWSQSAVSKGDTQFELGAFDEAIMSYKSALSENPEELSLVSKIATCYAYKNDFLNSSNWFKKIVDSANVSPDELFAYGQILKSLKLYGQAKHYFERYSMYDFAVGNHFMRSCDFAMQGIIAPPAVDVSNPYFNTPYSDFAPTFLGEKLVFTSFRKDIAKTRQVNMPSKVSNHSNSDVYMVDPDDNAQVQLLLDNLSDHSLMGPISFSEDHKMVAITKNNFSDKSRFFLADHAAMNIYFAEVKSDGSWGTLKPFVFNDNSYSAGFPWLSEDGNTLLFSSNMPGGSGGYDLYVSHKDGHAWTTPENLGEEINTPGNEIAPYKTLNNLYFSSDWHAGYGGFDVFALSNDDIVPEVINMGFGVNSSKDDFGFIFNDESEQGYLSSDRTNSRGGLDIYKVQGQMREVTIIVKDKMTKEPVANAMVKFVNINTNLVTDADGIAKVALSNNTEELIVISTEGYYELNMKLANLKKAKLNMKYDVFIERKTIMEETSIVRTEPNEIETFSELETSSEVVETAMTPNDPIAPVEMEKNIPVSKKKVYVKLIPQEKFSIQVSAFTKGKFDRDQYGNLESIGRVYDFHEANMTKVRVGYFEDKSAASEFLKQVRQMGYKDAFVVTELISEDATANTSGSAYGNATGSQYFEDNSDYKVRLATYSHAGKFDAGRVQHLGKLESYKKGEMTIMLLAGYPTILDAKIALKAAKMNGFTDAYIVKDMGGVLEKINLD